MRGVRSTGRADAISPVKAVLAVLILAGLLGLLGIRGAAADTSPQTDLALLNQERAAWGLPSNIAENPAWSAGCAAHNAYERQNGGQLTHTEQPGAPGYTDGGAYAGQHSVLSMGSVWRAGANPFEDAPVHLIQLFTPSLAQVGLDDSSGYVCVTTFPGLTAPAPAQETVSTYPSNGSSGFLTAEDAQESPFVPGDFVGLPQGTTTGREIFVYLDEPGQTGPAQVKILQAALSSPAGPLAVKTVDNSTATIGPYLTGGIIIPEQPLPQGVPINATVTVTGAGGPVPYSWTFTTAQAPHPVVSVSGKSLTFTSSNPAAAFLRIFAPPTDGSYYVLDQPIATGTNALPVDRLPSDTRLEACVSQRAAGGYDPVQACSAPFTVAGQSAVAETSGGSTPPGPSLPSPSYPTSPSTPSAAAPPPIRSAPAAFPAKVFTPRISLRLRGRRLELTVPAVLVGHRVDFSTTLRRRSCRAHRCRSNLRAVLHRKLLLTARQVQIPLASSRGSNQVTVTLSQKGFHAYGYVVAPVTATVSGGW